MPVIIIGYYKQFIIIFIIIIIITILTKYPREGGEYWNQSPKEGKIQSCSSPLHEMAEYLHTTCVHPQHGFI